MFGKKQKRKYLIFSNGNNIKKYGSLKTPIFYEYNVLNVVLLITTTSN